MLDYIIGRLREHSTWRGIILVSTAVAVTMNPEQADNYMTLGLALAGANAILTPDK